MINRANTSLSRSCEKILTKANLGKTVAASSSLKSSEQLVQVAVLAKVLLRQNVSGSPLPDPSGKGKAIIDEVAEKTSKKKKATAASLKESLSSNNWKIVEKTSSATIPYMANVLILKDINENALLLEAAAGSKKKIEDLRKRSSLKTQIAKKQVEEYDQVKDSVNKAQEKLLVLKSELQVTNEQVKELERAKSEAQDLKKLAGAKAELS
ncbi:hypothetical protein TorRG33x02_054660 [Trema orientale]|uniref:Uncharacterized protein n=1 Tax=Trema orientale TaxID=63057 RepID=A0A2P5FM22_TREOI|nr:hypothetical protein TorRG33x02_054660 [Trema orientale]